MARHTMCMSSNGTPLPHGHFLAAEVGELAGVSGTTIGQWARRGYIRSSRSDGDPHVYSVEDVAEAAIVSELLARGVRHADVRRTIAGLQEEYGTWPLSEALLATTAEDGRRPRVVLRDSDGLYALSARGWQRMAAPPPVEEVRLRLRRSSGPPRGSKRTPRVRRSRRTAGPSDE
jgi:DNA-binding transcriptional MerR regulator